MSRGSKQVRIGRAETYVKGVIERYRESWTDDRDLTEYERGLRVGSYEAHIRMSEKVGIELQCDSCHGRGVVSPYWILGNTEVVKLCGKCASDLGVEGEKSTSVQ